MTTAPTSGLPARDTPAHDAEPPAPDLDAYLARIGVADARTPDLPTLRRIVLGHAQAIPFENLDPFTGREVRLDPGRLAAKLVTGGRGGYCFEHNLLLRGVLDALGYRTTGLAARVLWNRPPDVPMPARGHMLLRVDLPEGPHLVDVGFGGLTLTGVLRLETEVVQETPHESFRLMPAGPDLLLQARIGDDWRTVYRFDLTEQYLADYEVSNWYLSRHPESHFVTGLAAARPAPGRRYALNGRTFTVHHLGGRSECRELDSPREIRNVLEQHFLVDTGGLPDLDEHLARVFR